MPTAKINGRTVHLPDSVMEPELRRVAGIDPQRTLIRRTREGNYVVQKGADVEVDEGDVFLDAPARVKGRC